MQNEDRQLEGTDKELMRKYFEQKTVIGKSVQNLVKSVVTQFVGMAMGISKSVTKQSMREVFELYSLGKLLRLN